MNYKRLTLISGHYGSGKTNIAVNMALDLKQTGRRTALADLDIVNPYFRAKDSMDMLEQHGIEFIGSAFANSNVDLPALPQEIYAMTGDHTLNAVIDVGGDERGALALGRLAPYITAENNYEMYMVINKYRPLTPDVPSVMEVFYEIQNACRIPFTGIINNSNLGLDTDAETVIATVDYAQAVAEAAGLPLVATTVEAPLAEAVGKVIPNVFPLNIKHLLERDERKKIL